MVELPEPEVADPASAEAMAKKAPWGRGGVPFPKKLHGSPTRVVAAQEAVDKRFGNWAEFLSFAPLDELFSLERESGEGGEAERAVIVVRPRLVRSDLSSGTQAMPWV
ncbi:unnamed protein product [Effrenium voratum]|uniref:Uncharacterized protein n=1 Tax=Effrenium voratum TaxID=2562239 RepID=A0AA36MYI2_9DINO|nr:unnamed protein product [Effrenium voratum]